MKFKTSKKNMRNKYDKIISIGYCDAQHLLRYHSPIAYSVGVNGWACDYYDIDGVLISTGYSPLKSKNTSSNYSIIRIYDKQARDIIHDYTLSYEDVERMVNETLKAYIKEVIN